MSETVISPASLTPADAQKAATAIIQDLTHPYHQKDHGEHGAAVERVQALLQQATSAPTAVPSAPPVAPASPGHAPLPTPAALKAKMGAMLLDTDHPLNLSWHPVHEAAIEEYKTLTADLVRAEQAPPPEEAKPEPLPFALRDIGREYTDTEKVFARDVTTTLQQLDTDTFVMEGLVNHAVELLHTGTTADAEATRAELQQEWGADQFTAKIRAAQFALERFPKHIQSLVRTTALGDDRLILQALALIGEPMLEAREKRNAMLLDRNNPMYHPFDPAYQAARAEFEALTDAAYGTRAAKTGQRR